MSASYWSDKSWFPEIMQLTQNHQVISSLQILWKAMTGETILKVMSQFTAKRLMSSKESH